MSCNGCRVLRKGCSDNCILRPCLQWIDAPEAQAHATLFVAKFFGRAGLMSFISSVPQNQRPSLFQSLLFEATGRTVNPVNGAVGLLWTGNWHVCQAAVDTVLRGGTLQPIPDLINGLPIMQKLSEASEIDVTGTDPVTHQRSEVVKRRRTRQSEALKINRNLLTDSPEIRRRQGSPSDESSVTTTCLDEGREVCVLNLFK